MKNPLILQTEGNQRTAFNRDMIMAVRDQGAGRNAKILLVNGSWQEVLHQFEYVVEMLWNVAAAPDPDQHVAARTAESNSVPAARGSLRVR